MANEAKHGVRFEEAAQAFTDPYSVDFADAVQPDRLVTLAMSPRERILYVVTTERGSRTREPPRNRLMCRPCAAPLRYEAEQRGTRWDATERAFLKIPATCEPRSRFAMGFRKPW